jgi:hypothetical protein
LEPELASDPEESLALEPVLNEAEFKEFEESPEPEDAEESHGVTVVVAVGAGVGPWPNASPKASASTRPRVRIMPTDKYDQCQEVNANDFGT